YVIASRATADHHFLRLEQELRSIRAIQRCQHLARGKGITPEVNDIILRKGDSNASRDALALKICSVGRIQVLQDVPCLIAADTTMTTGHRGGLHYKVTIGP